MKDRKIVWVSGDDWRGIYVDGTLYFEGHDIPQWIIFEVCGVPYKEIDADLDWLAERGNLPKDLAEVKGA